MEQSRVFQNTDFLRELSHANHNRQAILITAASRRQISAISDVIFRITTSPSYRTIALIFDGIVLS